MLQKFKIKCTKFKNIYIVAVHITRVKAIRGKKRQGVSVSLGALEAPSILFFSLFFLEISPPL
jgi:hypothetical protein